MPGKPTKPEDTGWQSIETRDHTALPKEPVDIWVPGRGKTPGRRYCDATFWDNGSSDTPIYLNDKEQLVAPSHWAQPLPPPKE